jgi:hypothetical protein
MRWTAASLVLATVLGACRGNPAGPTESQVLLLAHGDTIVYMTPDAPRSDDISALAIDAETRIPVSGVDIEWQVTAGSATVGAVTSRTDVYGVASTWLRQAGPGTYQVRASTPRLKGPAPTLQVRVVQRPAIANVLPGSVTAGGEVTVTGSNFSPEAQQNIVTFSGVRGRVLSATASQLRVEVPHCLPSRQVLVAAGLGSVWSAPHALTAAATAGAVLELAPGAVQTLAAPTDLACIRFPADGNASYALVVHNTATLFAPPFGFELRALTPQAPVAATSLQPAATPAPSFRDGWEAQLRFRERAYVGGVEEPAGERLRAAAAVPAVGSRRDFNVFDAKQEFRKITATARLVTAGSILYVDDDAEAAFTAADLEYFGDLFENPIRPTLTAVFGPPTDIDGNQRVIILFTPVVNELTPRGSSSFVTGFFYGCDLVSRSRCSGTNQAEILYSMVPDPLGRWSDSRSRAVVNAVVPPVIAHELQHMLHFARRNSTTDALWLYEALAHTAEELVADALQADARHSLAQLFRNGNRDRAQRFLAAPSATSLIAEEPPGTVEMRGAAWLFLKYLRGHYGGDDLLRRLTSSQRSGVANIVHETGREWAPLTAAFGVSLWADAAPEVRGIIDPRYTFTGAGIRGLLTSGAGVYPLQPTRLNWADFALAGTIAPGGHAYFTMTHTSGAPAAVNMVLSGVRGAPFATTSTAAISIVRLR